MQTYTLKFVLVGDSGIGKTQLLRRYCNKEFITDPKSTLNMEFSTREIPFERCIIKAQVWDTVGQERFESLTKAYYRDALGALLVYDVNRRDSFEHVKTIWLKQLRSYGHERLHIVLVGNKADEESPEKTREVSREEAIEFARANGMDFAETSAKSNANVEPVFRRVILNVATLIPAINDNLGMTGLPRGWIHLSRTSDQAKAQGDNDKTELIQKTADAAAEKYQNFWTGAVTETIPTTSAETLMLFESERHQSVTAPSFYRQSLTANQEKSESLRIAGDDVNTGDDEVDTETIKSKCNNCAIL